MRRASGPGDNDAQAALLRGACVTLQVPRRAVCRDDLRLVRHAKLGAGLRRALHRRPIGIAAHDDADNGPCRVLLLHNPLALLDAPPTEVIEDRYAISLGPDPDVACVREGVVLHVEQVLVVERDLEVVALNIDAQRVPLGGSDLLFHAVAALAAYDI